MEFKRFEGFFGGGLLQKEFDEKLPKCPFCGEYPHWLLNHKTGWSSNSTTCMCEKCKGKLNIIHSGLTIDDLQVVDLGEKNIHNLALNASYHIIALNSLAKIVKTADAQNNFFEQESTPNITHNVGIDHSTTKKQTGVILGIISFIVTFCLFLWILLPAGVSSPTSSQLKPVMQSSMSVEESFGYYYVTITGSTKNTSKKTMDYVSITFTLYDSAGNVVGTAIDNQSGLGAGETWIYSASGISTTNRPVSWKSTDITVICY